MVMRLIRIYDDEVSKAVKHRDTESVTDLLCEPLIPLPGPRRPPPTDAAGVPPMDHAVPLPSMTAPNVARKTASTGPMPTTFIVASRNWLMVA